MNWKNTIISFSHFGAGVLHAFVLILALYSVTTAWRPIELGTFLLILGIIAWTSFFTVYSFNDFVNSLHSKNKKEAVE